MIYSETLSVLLVEDNPLDRKVLLRDLARFGDIEFDVEVVGSVAECKQALVERRFDCILLDLTLPDSSGLPTVSEIVGSATNSPIIVLTGLSDPTFAVQAVGVGAQDYLVKGQVDQEVDSRSIRYTVARHGTEQQLRAAQAHLDVLRDRERIARDLHDTVIQQLFATGMGLQSLAGRIDDQGVRDMISSTITEIDAGIRQLREAVFDLHGTGASSGLVQEIQELIDARSSALNLHTEAFLDPRADLLPASVGEDLRATVAEALANVAKHAGATKVDVDLRVNEGVVRLRVTDNGRGLDSTGAQRPGRDETTRTGHGLVNLAERAAGHGGQFELTEAASGGTALTWQVPLD